jgi:hypothetical protein
MGSLVPFQTQVETKDGELLVTINLNLNIKLDSGGRLSLDVQPNSDTPVKENPPTTSKVKFEKPDLEDNIDIIDFGKKI